MNPKNLPLVAAFIGLTANAASVTYTTDLPEVCVVQTCPDNRTFEVPRFNGSMGTLTGVTVVFTVTATDRFGMENVCLSQSCTGIARADWTAKLCAGSTVLATSTIHDAVAQSVGQYDGVFDSGGMSGRLETPNTLTKSVSLTPSVSFTGSGNITLTSNSCVKHSFTKDASGLGTPIPTNLFKVAVSVSVTYTYNPI